MSDDQPIDPKKEEKQAIERLALTDDGRLLHRYLRRILESCRLTENSGALQRQEGGRMLARDLMNLMAQGIEDTTSAAGRRDPADQPVLAGLSKPINAGKRLSAREWIAGNDPELQQFAADEPAAGTDKA